MLCCIPVEFSHFWVFLQFSRICRAGFSKCTFLACSSSLDFDPHYKCDTLTGPKFETFKFKALSLKLAVKTSWRWKKNFKTKNCTGSANVLAGKSSIKLLFSPCRIDSCLVTSSYIYIYRYILRLSVWLLLACLPSTTAPVETAAP